MPASEPRRPEAGLDNSRLVTDAGLCETRVPMQSSPQAKRDCSTADGRDAKRRHLAPLNGRTHQARVGNGTVVPSISPPNAPRHDGMAGDMAVSPGNHLAAKRHEDVTRSMSPSAHRNSERQAPQQAGFGKTKAATLRPEEPLRPHRLSSGSSLAGADACGDSSSQQPSARPSQLSSAEAASDPDPAMLHANQAAAEGAAALVGSEINPDDPDWLLALALEEDVDGVAEAADASPDPNPIEAYCPDASSRAPAFEQSKTLPSPAKLAGNDPRYPAKAMPVHAAVPEQQHPGSSLQPEAAQHAQVDSFRAHGSSVLGGAHASVIDLDSSPARDESSVPGGISGSCPLQNQGEPSQDSKSSARASYLGSKLVAADPTGQHGDLLGHCMGEVSRTDIRPRVGSMKGPSTTMQAPPSARSLSSTKAPGDADAARLGQALSAASMSTSAAGPGLLGSFRDRSGPAAGSFIRQGSDGRGGRTKSLLQAANRHMPASGLVSLPHNQDAPARMAALWRMAGTMLLAMCLHIDMAVSI